MNSNRRISQILTLALVTLAIAGFAPGCSKKSTSSAENEPQKTFPTPLEAGQALHAAAQAGDDKAMAQVLGSRGKQLVSSGDASEDKSATGAFAHKYERMNRLVAMTDGSQVLYVGADNYPFPIPLKKDNSSRWYFDASAGEQELLTRRIGRNELYALDTLRMLADAEDRYHRATHQYTSVIVSTPGKQDGLYWAAATGQAPSPLAVAGQLPTGALDASAPSNTLVSHGYSFQVVATKAGFILFANPVEYKHSGIMSFSLGNDGVLYEQDLAPQALADAIAQYNPAHGWTQAE